MQVTMTVQHSGVFIAASQAIASFGHWCANVIVDLSIRYTVTGLAVCLHSLIVTLLHGMMVVPFESVRVSSCNRKLFTHFGEAGAAIFTIEQV